MRQSPWPWSQVGSLIHQTVIKMRVMCNLMMHVWGRLWELGIRMDCQCSQCGKGYFPHYNVHSFIHIFHSFVHSFIYLLCQYWAKLASSCLTEDHQERLYFIFTLTQILSKSRVWVSELDTWPSCHQLWQLVTVHFLQVSSQMAEAPRSPLWLFRMFLFFFWSCLLLADLSTPFVSLIC